MLLCHQHADLELHDMEQQILQIRRRLQRQQQAAEGVVYGTDPQQICTVC